MKVPAALLCVILAGCDREKQDRPNTEEEDQPAHTPRAERTKAGTLLWTFETGGSVHSSPAVGIDGTVYVGGGNFVYALDGKTGAKKWEFEANGVVRSSPALGDDDTVYIGGGRYVYAFEGRTGVKKWEFETGIRKLESGPEYSGVHGSPAVGPDGTIYIGTLAGKFYAIDGKAGTQKWEVDFVAPLDTSAAISPDNIVYIGAPDSHVYALEGKTGELKWHCEIEFGVGNGSSPAIGADDTVYVGGKMLRMPSTARLGPRNGSL